MTDPGAKQAEKNSELIDRYVAAVERRLPSKTAKDIGAELREAVMSKLEAREAELGRPATRSEVSEIIRSFGSPMLAAYRYIGSPHLIGPEVYPYYWPTVRIVVGITAAVAIVGFLVQGILSDNPMQYALRGWGAAVTAAWVSFAITTVVFIVLDRTKAGLSIEKSWRPEQLPKDTFGKPKSLFESLFSLAWDALFIAWWVGLLKLPNGLPGEPGHEGLTVEFSSAWGPVYGLVLAMSVMSAVIHLADVFHPTWTWIRSVASAAVTLIGLGCVWLLSQGGALFAVHGLDGGEKLAKLNATFEIVSKITLWSMALGFAIALVIEVWRLTRGVRVRATPVLV